MELVPPESIERWLIAPVPGTAWPSKFVGLDDLGKSLVLATLFQRTNKPVVAVFNSRGDARNAVDNLRFFVGQREKIRTIPVLDFDFHRNLMPNPQDCWEKNSSLFHLINDSAPAIYVTTVGALLQKTLAPEQFLDATLSIRPEMELPRESAINALIRNGYQMLPNASDPGSFAVRGGILDIFSPLYENPLRIEYLGDFVESLRFFRADDQRSLDPVIEAQVIPVKQSLIPRGKEFLKIAPVLKERLDNLGYPKSDRDELLIQIQDGTPNAAYDHLFPILSGRSSPLYQYFPDDALLAIDGQLMEAASQTEFPRLQKSHSLFEQHPSPIATLESLTVNPAELGGWLSQINPVCFESFGGRDDGVSFLAEPVPLGITTTQSSGKLPLENLAKKFHDWMDQGYRIHVVCHSRIHAERMESLFATYGLKCEIHSDSTPALQPLHSVDFQRIHIWHGFITHTALYPRLRLAIISEEAIFGKKKRSAASGGKGHRTVAQHLSFIRELKTNDYVVHKDHGIGRYLGLQSRDFLGIPNDYAVIEYRDGDKLYVPIYRLNIIQKFAAAEATSPALDKLGGDRWGKTKSKVQKAIAHLAAQFLETHARRKLIPVEPCRPAESDYEQFEMEFPFDETPDQLKAIDDLDHDLMQSHPMSRLLCGDVGYGKTEIAMRAAYRVAMSGKQVSVLVPTTILAFQHFETFSRRFKNTPIRVDMVSRLRSSAQIKTTLTAVGRGEIDIIIGTHRVLSSDFQIPNLGLVVIDEEHRFGVLHKERLKKLSQGVHTLSMTATPIPRTLNMAMAGIMDISIITTPPPDRLSVRTFVCRHDEEILREAISNELARDGQIYYVHNRIESIHTIADELRSLFPSLRFQVVHGQMEAEELEKCMIGFFKNDFQVLVSTSIVESGLDNPLANTIIIDRADHFGLAQLYQLRGRVGRADKRAYCYLMIPDENKVSSDAKQRLQIMQRYSELGSGFQIASQDLDSRGAGDLLGEQQSGHLNAVGTDLYFELLEEAIQELQGKPLKIEIEPDINLRIPAYFPDVYLPDVSERVNTYRRLSSLVSPEEIAQFEEELTDRFGKPPVEVINLLGLMYLRIHLKRLHVIRMSCGPKRTTLQFASTTPASPTKIVALIQKNPGGYSLTPDQRLVFDAPEADWKILLREIEMISERLGVSV